MPAKDRIFKMIKNALIKDGWAITHEPYRIRYESDTLYTDLGAEKTLAAERDGTLIAVEVKSFLGDSPLRDFEEALGQYNVYLAVMRTVDPDRKLFMAVSDATFSDVFGRPAVRLALQQFPVAILVVDIVSEEVVQWIP